jgi:hypothetical protein
LAHKKSHPEGSENLSVRHDRSRHDRYANIEIVYPLQRIETYRGIATLATNSRYFIAAASSRKNRAALLYKMSRFCSGVRYSVF